MKKKYNLPEENPEKNMVNEPISLYGINTETEILPTLTDEELKECITGDELREHMREYIHELFSKK